MKKEMKIQLRKEEKACMGKTHFDHLKLYFDVQAVSILSKSDLHVRKN